MTERIVTFFGWYGTTAILAAYALLTLGTIQPSNLVYIFLNISGSIGLVWQSHRKKDTPLVFLNAVWLLIALVGLAGYLRG